MLQRLQSWLGNPSWFRSLSTGEHGERLAAEFLQHQGYAVVARNWRDPQDRRDELDLICRDGEVLVFVEVKTRAATALVAGFFAVDSRKKKYDIDREMHAATFAQAKRYGWHLTSAPAS